MGLSLSDCRSRLRTAMGDVTGPPNMWSDDALTEAVKQAVSAHSALFPQRVLMWVDVADGAQEYMIYALQDPLSHYQRVPSGVCTLYRVLHAENPPGNVL